MLAPIETSLKSTKQPNKFSNSCLSATSSRKMFSKDLSSTTTTRTVDSLSTKGYIETITTRSVHRSIQPPE